MRCIGVEGPNWRVQTSYNTVSWDWAVTHLPFSNWHLGGQHTSSDLIENKEIKGEKNKLKRYEGKTKWKWKRKKQGNNEEKMKKWSERKQNKNKVKINENKMRNKAGKQNKRREKQNKRQKLIVVDIGVEVVVLVGWLWLEGLMSTGRGRDCAGILSA